MKEIYIPKKVPRIEVREKLHGHTQILLRSERTGRIERIEHDNMFTDGIESFIKDRGSFRSGLSWGGIASQSRPYFVMLLGGIMLFDTALPTSPSAKYMPAGTTMTANGSYGVSNSDVPTEMGSYNSVESVEGTDSCTFVYDWGTAQGNGNIASVALTTKNGGYIGYGNASLANKSLTNLYADIENTYTVPPAAIGPANDFRTAANAKMPHNNNFYVCMLSSIPAGTTSIPVKYRSLSIDAIDVFENWKNADVSSYPHTITFTVPALSSAYQKNIAGAAYPSCFLLTPNVNINNGASFTLYLLDVDDGTTTPITVTNNTGETITGQYCYLIDDTYMVVKTASGWGKINYKTSQYEGVVTNSSGKGGYQPCRGLITDSLLSITSDNWIYDPVLNQFLPTNGSLVGTGTRTGQSSHYIPEYDALCYMGYGGNTGSITECLSVMPHPLRLMTINNLDFPVAKTSDKTMKVTYTITRAS